MYYVSKGQERMCSSPMGKVKMGGSNFQYKAPLIKSFKVIKKYVYITTLPKT